MVVESLDELQQIHERAEGCAELDDRVELSETKILYGNRLHTFRVRYLLPLTLEIQWIDEAPSGAK